MPVALGIDTGGTYTDAVLVDHLTGTVIASSKSLTTRDDLAIGITGAIEGVFSAAAAAGQAVTPDALDLVGLSTTLATNAIVEDRGTPVCLLLIGYDRDLIQRGGFERDLVTRDIVYVAGGHDGQGDEVAPLDEEAVCRAVRERCHRVEAVAISGYFGVRNPAHEVRARQLVEAVSHEVAGEALPVTCGHELTSRLDSVRRAATVALNARLIPLLRELITTMRRTLAAQGVPAPLMIVKGDGSLVQADWAMRRPIETILSGPAASVVGAWHLAGRRDSWVVDVGGTTTDIAVLRGGLPRLNPEGARVGRWRTMIETVDVHTAGLGGDSRVRVVPGTRELTIGPRRSVPLCQLASVHPGVVDELQRQLAAREHLPLTGQFALAQRRSRAALDARGQELLAHLDTVPRSLLHLTRVVPSGLLAVHQVEELEARQVLIRAAFTPTDALHVLGRFEHWNTAAARLGAELLAAQLGITAATLCERVVAQFSRRLAAEVAAKALADEGCPAAWETEPGAAALLARAFGTVPETALACSLQLDAAIVAVGAPVGAYAPAAANHLHTELVIPPHAGVANAIGSVATGVVQRLRVLIRPSDLVFRAYLPDEVVDFADLEAATEHARQVAVPLLQDQARQAGAGQTEVQMTRTDRTAPDGYGGGEIYVESELVFTAVGGPGLRPTAATPDSGGPA
jgi:N-methylhydantoinase A/oxoprolinase/acetone carboxylase beta subunit